MTPGFEDLLFAHSSWFTYGSMLRSFKSYKFGLADPGSAPFRPGNQVAFSSYPGLLSSLDDFYLMGGGLALVQTTNSIFNLDLYKLVTPETALAWQRVRVANWAASSGASWQQLFSHFNSGTYNNQYMVIDLSKFTPNKGLEEGLLQVVEQIPGLVVGEDMTRTLQFGYWPSFNVPFFREIYDKSGYANFTGRQAARGPEYAKATEGLDYQQAPRSKIFRRDAGNVTDLASLQYLMRYNGWKPTGGDKYADTPMGAICSRGDLDPKNPRPGGCYDSKVTNYALAKRLAADIVNGPTAQNQPAFSWTPEFNSTSHLGQPHTFDFAFERTSWPFNATLAGAASTPASVVVA